MAHYYARYFRRECRKCAGLDVQLDFVARLRPEADGISRLWFFALMLCLARYLATRTERSLQKTKRSSKASVVSGMCLESL